MPLRSKRWVVVGAAALLAVGAVTAVLLLLVRHAPAPSPPKGQLSPGATPAPSVSATPPGPQVPVSCSGNEATDTPALEAAIKDGEAKAGSVVIAAGTCALSDHLLIGSPVTITGAGATATFLVQHARTDIFGISGDSVTIENLNLNTATYNTTAPVLKNPNPPVLYSTGNNTTVANVTGEAGSGFGMRITGPNPCYQHSKGGAVVSNVNITNSGTGGFASVDIDCQNHATLTNITIHGGIISIYRDSNLSLKGEHFTPGPAAKTCAPPWFVTSDANGHSQNITISDVTSAGGRGVVRGTVDNLLINNQTVANPACG